VAVLAHMFMTAWRPVLTAVPLVVLLSVGCGNLNGMLPQGFEVAVMNGATAPVVAKVSVQDGTALIDRYYLVAPNMTAIVDTIGEANPATPFVAILDSSCVEVIHIDGPFQQGALIALDGAVQPTREHGRPLSQSRPHSDPLSGFASCAEATTS
jgi:hypothetical protein